jgi:ATP-dependent DNA helicase RecG
VKLTTQNIHQILSAGESETLEFKSLFDRETIDTLSAFSNVSGGMVIVGVTDNGMIKGGQLGKETINDWLGQIKSSTSPAIIPDIAAIQHCGKTIVLLSIPPFPLKPVSCKARYFKRVASSNQQMQLSQIADMYLQTLQISWDSYPHEQAGLDDLDVQQIERFIAKVNTGGRFQLEESQLGALEKLRFIRGDKPTPCFHVTFC